MSLVSDWKLGKFLEWYTELPYLNRPRKSPTFLFQNNECYFLLYKDSTNKYYYMYLKTKKVPTKLEKVFFTLYMLYANACVRKEVNFSDQETSILFFNESYVANQTLDLSHGIFIRFIFVFENSDGPLLASEATTDDKSTQTDLILPLQTDVEHLSWDLGELLQNGDHSDVQVLCNGGSIPAHTAILAARSKAFSDMFRDSTEESKSYIINFNTTEKPVMELCLEFIYKGKILNLSVEEASNLYGLGHFLKISSLAKMCADLIIRNLCEDNYISYLFLSDKYNDDYLKSGVIDYICEHTELLKSESWIKFSDKYLKTAVDVYRKCLSK